MDKMNGTVNTVGSRREVDKDEDDEPLLELGRVQYTLPKFRYSTFFIAVIFIDGIVSVVLWLTGGNTEYFVDNIVDFHWKESVFDLALMASVKVILIAAAILPILENYSFRQIDNPYEQNLKQRTKLLHIVLVLLTLTFWVFCSFKGGFILNAIINQADYKTMHKTYNALVISAFVFSLIEFLFGIYSFTAMRKLKVIRILHRYNDDGQEVDKDGKPLKKKVDVIRLVKLARPEAGMLSVAGVGLLVSSASQIAAPLFFGKVVDAAQESMESLTRTVLILLGVYCVGAVFSMLRSWMFEMSGMRLVARLRKKLFGSIIQQEIAFFDTNRTGELCNRLSSDTQVIQNAVTNNVSMLVRYILQLIGSLGFMFYLNAALTGVLLAIVPVISLAAVQYGKYVKNLRKKFQDKLGEAGTVAEESISSMRTVRMFSAETKSSHLYGVEIDASYKIGKKLALIIGTFTGTIGIIAYGAVTVVLWYGGKLVYDNTHGSHTGLTPGVLTSFLLYTLQVAMCFSILSSLYGDFMQAVGASIRIFDLLDRKPTVSIENGVVLGHLDGKLEFNEVRFTYPSRPESEILKGLSFSLEPGEVLALVGPSGGGKSTIVSLIERFYDPDAGQITLGDRNLKELDPQWFRQKISMVSQEPTLFACSIKDNISYGRLATDQEIEEAAKKANAHEFISTFEEGYDTMVGERGVRLSGGQKQRIAIARALVMDPVLLLLDEATSALDAESEHLVQEAIERAMKGRTVIVIAHRLSTVRNASKVIVIDKGAIAEQGTHNDLIAKNGVYKRLVLRQLMAGSTANDAESINSAQPSLEDNDST